MGIISYLRERLFDIPVSPDTHLSQERRRQDQVRASLSLFEGLSKAEIDEYIAYEYEGIEVEFVSYEYMESHPDERYSFLYNDDLLLAIIARRHTNQISPETKEKVKRALKLASLHHRLGDK